MLNEIVSIVVSLNIFLIESLVIYALLKQNKIKKMNKK